jgi:AraC-like DNA-binding protein
VAFKKDTGFTILDCLNTIRIRRAAELIVYSDHGFAQVADMCGFTSVTHFNRVFLKYVGITPGQCRRAYPANILFGTGDGSANPSNRFMYSVLAHKTITPKMIRDLGTSESKK